MCGASECVIVAELMVKTPFFFPSGRFCAPRPQRPDTFASSFRHTLFDTQTHTDAHRRTATIKTHLITPYFHLCTYVMCHVCRTLHEDFGSA